MIDAAKAGNVVAWWRLKARAGTQLPATAQGITAPGLSALEREALIAVMGPGAAQPSGTTAISGMAARGQVWTAMVEGWGQPLELESWRLLKAAGAPVSATPPPSALPQPPMTGGTVPPAPASGTVTVLQAGVGGLPWWALVAVGGGLLLATTRRR